MDLEAVLGTGGGETRHLEEVAVLEERHHHPRRQEEAAALEPVGPQWTGLADLPRD